MWQSEYKKTVQKADPLVSGAWSHCNAVPWVSLSGPEDSGWTPCRRRPGKSGSKGSGASASDLWGFSLRFRRGQLYAEMQHSRSDSVQRDQGHTVRQPIGLCQRKHRGHLHGNRRRTYHWYRRDPVWRRYDRRTGERRCKTRRLYRSFWLTDHPFQKRSDRGYQESQWRKCRTGGASKWQDHSALTYSGKRYAGLL